MKNEKGLSLIEVLISSALGLFMLFTVLYFMGNILTRTTLLTKKVQLADELSNRVSDFIISNNFDSNNLNAMSFSKSTSSNGLNTFTARNNDFGISITQQAFAST